MAAALPNRDETRENERICVAIMNGSLSIFTGRRPKRNVSPPARIRQGRGPVNTTCTSPQSTELGERTQPALQAVARLGGRAKITTL